MKKISFYLCISLLVISCGGPDNGTVEIDGVLPGEHRVFITKNASIDAKFSDSGFTGLTGADKLCLTYAKAAGLKNDYKAILSDGTTSAKDRLVISGSIYVVSGSIKTKIAEDAAALWNASTTSLLAKIDWDEDGRSVASGTAWTGTSQTGTVNTDHCTNWTTTASGNGTVGDVNQIDGNWIDSNTQSCGGTAHLYCISQ